MADEQGVLASTIKNNLSDKALDKRKQAAQDISDAVRHLLRGTPQSVVSVASTSYEGHEDQVAGLIRCLVEEFCRSGFPMRRRGGLSALASTALALERGPVQVYVDKLVPPVLLCFSDEDAGVRYNACEAFYNIAKVARPGILPFINAVFDGLCKLYADVDADVKDGGACLDRLVRDIVSESRDFNYGAFVPMLTERIRVLNPFVRKLVLEWILLLDSVPVVDMIAYLPQFLEGLFSILADNNRDIRKCAETCLTEFLADIKGRPRSHKLQAIADAAPTVARCCRAGERRPEDNYVKLTALRWLLEFVRLQVEAELLTSPEPEACPISRQTSPSAHHPRQTSPHDPRGRAGPCMVTGGLRLMTERSVIGDGDGEPMGQVRTADDQHRPPARHRRVSSHSGVQTIASSHSGIQTIASSQENPKLPPGSGLQMLAPVMLEGALACLDDLENEIQENAVQANKALLDAAQRLGSHLPVEAIMEAVLGAMNGHKEPGQQEMRRSESVLLACFRWARLLLERCPVRVLRPPACEKLFEACLAALGRPEDEVVTTALRLISQLVSTRDEVYGEDVAGASRPWDDLTSTAPCPRIIATSSAGNLLGVSWLGSSFASSPSAGSSTRAEAAPSGDSFAGMCQRLFALMAEDNSLLDSKGELVVRELCAGIGAGRFYYTAAQAVAGAPPEDGFARRFVRVLNRVLLTSHETKSLRVRLFQAATISPRPGASYANPCADGEAAAAGPLAAFQEDSGEGVPQLLLNLLCSWFHCPVSTLALCLWFHWFELAAEVSVRFAYLEFTRELRSELDDLIELLESPVFVRVRLQMLETRRHPALLRTILALVALLPREPTLRARLGLVETELLLERLAEMPAPPAIASMCKATESLLVNFDVIANQHGFRKCVL